MKYDKLKLKGNQVKSKRQALLKSFTSLAKPAVTLIAKPASS